MTEQIKTMPLRPGQKLVINGAVVRMGSDGSSLELDLKTPVLTEDELLSEADATTPATRIYFLLLVMYLDPSSYDATYLPFMDRMIELLQATTIREVRENLRIIMQCVEAGRQYEALQACRALVLFEKEVLAIAEAARAG
ncbi:flagellar biosynthesis repressor FlbT [Oceanibaculum nanhaiense]|uniref:flagellar biosynthesis repressor FlbT n=1 Tax=Oceanibaculum nanhaiense TaxID=1909734 RepID=UPI003D2B1522